jgi:two-component system, chemotaxis family, sensor kinase CheA
MDGFTLTETLRKDQKYGNVPIIIVTSREREEDKKRGIRVGANAYIVKGAFDQSNLLETVRSLIG